MWPFNRKPAPAVQPERSSPTRIAILEHDLFGIQPQPGTAAALAVSMRKLRRAGTCLEHDPIPTSRLQDRIPTAICQRCGDRLIEDDGGEWKTAGIERR